MRRSCAWWTTFLFCWTVTGTPFNTVDGDTFDATVSIWVGFQDRAILVPERIRVLGVDTPEMKGTTLDAAKAARDFTQKWLAQGPVTINTCKRDAFGRILGIVHRDSQILADDLIAAGHGVKR